MITIRTVIPTNDNVTELIRELNEYQIGLYGIEQCNLETPVSLMNNNAYMVGAFSDQQLIGIGAIKIFDSYGEIKRMFVREQFRGLPIAKNILEELENFARKKEIPSICLETGNLHHAAIRFYKKHGYQQVGSFGNYKPNAVSIYFAKHILS